MRLNIKRITIRVNACDVQTQAIEVMYTYACIFTSFPAEVYSVTHGLAERSAQSQTFWSQPVALQQNQQSHESRLSSDVWLNVT